VTRRDLTTVSHAPKEARELLDKLQTLSDTLDFLRDFVNKNSALVQNSAVIPTAEPRTPLVLNSIIDRCSSLLKKLENYSRELQAGGLTGAKRRLLWFLDKELLVEAGVEVQQFVILFGQCRNFEGV
jgi:hypothetical protein